MAERETSDLNALPGGLLIRKKERPPGGAVPALAPRPGPLLPRGARAGTR